MHVYHAQYQNLEDPKSQYSQTPLLPQRVTKRNQRRATLCDELCYQTSPPYDYRGDIGTLKAMILLMTAFVEISLDCNAKRIRTSVTISALVGSPLPSYLDTSGYRQIL